MPCYATGSAQGDAELDASEAYETATKATRAACELVKLVRKHRPSILGYCSVATVHWIKHHDKIDRDRKKEEKRDREKKAAKRKVLAKLSKKELRLLEEEGL